MARPAERYIIVAPSTHAFVRRLSTIAIPLLVVAGSGTSLGAQARTFALEGVAVDSIHGGPLAGATIVVDGADRLTMSDDGGLFRIDSVPAGSWRLAIFHPLLDTLGLVIATQPIEFGSDSVVRLVLGTPSVATLADEWCAPPGRRLGPGVILGRVLSAESGDPAGGVRVSVAWQQTVAVAGAGLEQAWRVRSATTDDAGRYALCGVTPAMRGTLQAERAGARTPELPIALEGREHAIQTVLLGAAGVAVSAAIGDTARAPGQRVRGTATLRGRVTDGDSRPLAGVQVTVEETGAETTTDSSGAYMLSALPAGTWNVVARRLGFTPGALVVSLPAHRTTELSFTLGNMAQQLAALEVRDTLAEGLQQVGFESRRRSGMGRYVTAAQIARRHPMRTTDLFVTIPGVSVVPDGRGGYALRNARDGGRGCMLTFVDGIPWAEGSAGDLDSQLPWQEIAAIEVYTPTTVPAEFVSPGRGSCGAVVFWTRTRVGAAPQP